MKGRRDRIRAKVMEKVSINPVTGCYDWLGSTSGDNGRGKDYPRMKLDGQTVAVHRVMWTNEFGYIPGKKTLDHVCRNRKCVRPGEDEEGRMHCEMVTHKENCKRRDKANGIVPKKRKRKPAAGGVGKPRKDAGGSKRVALQAKAGLALAGRSSGPPAGTDHASDADRGNARQPRATPRRDKVRNAASEAWPVDIGAEDRPAPAYTKV